ncbi:glycosyltransferase family 22 protein [Lasiosphaeria miniovina]|uniref:Mannosyltransferase n=1 Tax=Lasiosphaeria miniovina TaxID=1954250 RepID=A0AA40AW16_9PEZI|nr:glycosyltransferase family 22 protein [Lasiosphaeria miniovina]KAK0723077.1 glycosyltransferase family 22 protein [Lasiosphaeria miniovina]
MDKPENQTGPSAQKGVRDVPPPPPPSPVRHPEVISALSRDVLHLLLAFRFINALCVRTFFQPDEYFQVLEPAWRLAFGSESGAWLTWEWQHQLRSSLHPVLFAAVYRAADALMAYMSLFPPFRAMMLVALPGVVQSVIAALGDYYTWKLATAIFGRESNAPWAALWMTVFNPWQWYCSTRTFSNSLETTLTIAALTHWPWELLGDAKTTKDVPLQLRSRVNSLRVSLLLAAVAVILRPTNIFIWLSIIGSTLTRPTLAGQSPLQRASLVVLFREILVCGTAVLALSVLSDRLYFGFWAFPPYKWLYFNVSQSLAVFYGQMPWHYYLVQGIPLLTTTFLPFALIGLYKAALSSKNLAMLQSNILSTLSLSALAMMAVLSVISHKEVRFIYPLLPILHIVAAPYITSFFTVRPTAPVDADSGATQPPPPTTSPRPVKLRRTFQLANILSINLLLAGYLSLFHQAAPISVMNFLRAEFERIHPDYLALGHEAANLSSLASTPTNPGTSINGDHGGHLELFVLFLTPCHSTPWRSHLVYPALRARSLTCEPPLHTAPDSAERDDYLDEADRFYAKDDHGCYSDYGSQFLANEMFPSVSEGNDGEDDSGEKKTPQHRGGEIPRYIVGFEGIESTLRDFFGDGMLHAMGGTLKHIKWFDNGAFNEDWRRRGRLSVWSTGVHPGSARGVHMMTWAHPRKDPALASTETNQI